MGALRVAASGCVVALLALGYAYVDMVAPQHTPMAFLGMAGIIMFRYGRALLAALLVIAFAVAPHVNMDKIFVAVATACLVGYLVASPPERSSGGIADDAEAKVRRILTKHAPHKLPKLPNILKKYDNDWNAMLMAAEDKYIYKRAAPTPFKSPAPAPSKRGDDEDDEADISPIRQPDFEAAVSPVAAMPEYLYDDRVAAEKPEPAAAPAPMSALGAARLKMQREQKMRTAERAHKLRSGSKA
mmetsp:Transcript_34812/g.109306  ORF Transcript_34812/g.109306 Transcript_34812/m.109306 type:complete len:243 (-) Transcript_34812:105-833(-)